jgi:proton-translocating NADH-quinone oxidoreductase chain L
MSEFTGEITHVEFAKVPLWFIALLPFLGAVTNAILGRRLQALPLAKRLQKSWHIGSIGVSAVAVGAMVGAFLLTVVCLVQLISLPSGQRYLYTHAWQMVRVGSLDVNFSFAMDELSALMTMIITGVGTLIHVYATSYMEKEPAYWRFFCYLNLFVFSMLLLVLGDNFIVMFFGWEGVGLCSYLLIGFWYKDYNKASAGMKAFVVNRVGDWGFVCGLALLFWGLGGAWLLDTGDYVPDFNARFATIVKSPLSHGDEHGAHGDDHGAKHDAHSALDRAKEEGEALETQGDTVLADYQPPGAGDGHDHKQPLDPRQPSRTPMPRGAPSGGPLGPAQKPPPQQLSGSEMGSLSMVTHGGARVFLGVETVEQLKRAMSRIGAADTPLPRCDTLPDWDAAAGAQLSSECYAEAPFIRKRMPAGLHRVAVVPGGGAVVSGDGDEYAGLLVRVHPNKETVIAPLGATVTFREIHDQLVAQAAVPEVEISDNHGHELILSADDIQGSKDRVFTLVGRVGDQPVHKHTFTLTTAQMGLLESGKAVTINTEGADHVHKVTIQRPQVMRQNLQEKSVWGIALVTLACLCFFVGATGKSAQIPLYVWLPDAMAGPTPVSALIHAATMVTAGVYMIARMNFLFSMTPTASGIVALVGAMTALFAATIGFFQYDIKKVLAYSTVSQLGFMFIGVGVGAYWAGVFHLMTHAFFKACLFLGSGSVIHGMHHVVHDEVGSQDMRNMGGLKRVMPGTALAYRIACIAITAVPPGLAGFWSKDEILWKAFNTHQTSFVPGWLIYSIGLLAALGTSFYMWRSYYLTFEGPHAIKKIKTDVHESPGAIVYVLYILAGLSVVSGVAFGISTHFLGGVQLPGVPHEPWLESWLHPVTAHNVASIGDAGYGWMYGLMALSVGGAIAMWYLARQRYGEGRDPSWAANEQAFPGFQLMQNKYYVDEIYQATIIKATMRLRLVFAEMDRWIVDGLVNGAGTVARLISWVAGATDRHVVDGSVNFVAEGTLEAGQKLRNVQTGRVQNYVYGILGGIAVLAVIQYFLG